jgi:hypothetical protein
VLRGRGVPSFDRDERHRTLEKLAPNFNDLDDRFYKLEGEVSVEGALTNYMRARSIL